MQTVKKYGTVFTETICLVHFKTMRKEAIHMENKFNMTSEDNIFWAKRNIVDTIYKNAKLEGINITF